jgi:phycocyanobilin:ferredoxin oxidoreductase
LPAGDWIRPVQAAPVGRSPAAATVELEVARIWRTTLYCTNRFLAWAPAESRYLGQSVRQVGSTPSFYFCSVFAFSFCATAWLGSEKTPFQSTRPTRTMPGPVSAEAASSALQMGSWRLRPLLYPPIQALAAQVEGAWRTLLPDLVLYQLPGRFTYMDSLDPEGNTPVSYMLPDPGHGDPAWPRLQVENRAYSSCAFRKLHMEVAARQDGLQVLHCVMYPHLTFDLPLLSMDLVTNEGRVTFAIIDPCPSSLGRVLPPYYPAAINELAAKYGVQSNRQVPEWGKDIFSDHCVICRPQKPEEVAAFLKYAIALTLFHVQMGRLAGPVGEEGRAQRLADIAAAHARYCSHQLRNDKTRRVLEKSFGAETAEEYMRTVMFDAAAS